MRPRWLLSGVLLALSAGCPSREPTSPENLCVAGEEIFCRCRGGLAGTKLCLDGRGFGPCGGENGECIEIPDPGDGGGGISWPTGGSGGEGEGGAAPPCAHALCEPGAELDPGCDPCVAFICSPGIDPYCCNLVAMLSGEWDVMCVSEVESYCGVTCAEGSGGGGGAGGCLGAANLVAGDLVITEIMNNPQAVADSAGEWFELFNARSACIDLAGVVISSLNDNSHTVGASVVVQAGDEVLVGRSTNTSINGNVPIAYGYGSAVNLANTDDNLALYTPGPNGVLIDASGYDGLLLNPNGASRSLTPVCLSHICNDTESSFCDASSTIAGSSDRGTPGAPNDPCP